MQNVYPQLLNPLAQDMTKPPAGATWEQLFGRQTIPFGQDAHGASLACSFVSVAIADYLLRLMPNAVISMAALTNAITLGSQAWLSMAREGEPGISYELSHALYYMQHLRVREMLTRLNLPGGDFGGDAEYRIDLEAELEWSRHMPMPVCALVLATAPTEGAEHMSLREQMERRGIGYTYCVASFLGCQERHRRGGHPSLTPFYITDSHGKSGVLYRARDAHECARMLRDRLGVDPATMEITWSWVRNPDIPDTREAYDQAVSIAFQQYQKIPDYPIRTSEGGSLLIPDTRADDEAERQRYLARIKRGAGLRPVAAMVDPSIADKPYEDHEYQAAASSSASSSDVRTSRRFIQQSSMYHPDAGAAPYIDTHVVRTSQK